MESTLDMTPVIDAYMDKLGYRDYRVSWQSGTKTGALNVVAAHEKHAYQKASPALAAISKEHALTYLDVTVEEIKRPNPTI